MPSGISAFANVLARLQNEQDVQISVKVLSKTGTTGLTILPVRPEIITVDAINTRLMLPHGLGLLTLEAHDLISIQKIPASDAWRLDFGPLIVNIEFRSTP
jgi:threonine/homoserine efflux transporter RhtA